MGDGKSGKMVLQTSYKIYGVRPMKLMALLLQHDRLSVSTHVSVVSGVVLFLVSSASSTCPPCIWVCGYGTCHDGR